MRDAGPAHTGIFRELHATIVPVRDLQAAAAWYEGVLGLEPRRVIDGFLVVYGTNGPTHLCLYVPEAGAEASDAEPLPQGDAGAFPNWRSDDIEATHAHLVAQGVPCGPIQAGGDLSFFTFHDPDGNRHDVCEYGPAWLP